MVAMPKSEITRYFLDCSCGFAEGTSMGPHVVQHEDGNLVNYHAHIAAVEAAREEERKAVVEWLREQGEEYPLAAAIERGVHKGEW